MTLLEAMKIRLGIRMPDEDCLLMLYLEDARAYILSYTNRTQIPDALQPIQVSIAVMLYNRRGMEGESSQTIGDITHVTDSLPLDIVRILNAWRLGKVLSINANP